MQDDPEETIDAKRMRTVTALTQHADTKNEIDGAGEYKWYDEKTSL